MWQRSRFLSARTVSKEPTAGTAAFGIRVQMSLVHQERLEDVAQHLQVSAVKEPLIRRHPPAVEVGDSPQSLHEAEHRRRVDVNGIDAIKDARCGGRGCCLSPVNCQYG